MNHPFRLGRGSIGKALPGMEVKLSPEGEILVRGENVAAGYWRESGVASMLDAEGWFHTGDLGERDANGNLYFKGREKNVIVTPAGLKIYPQDLEAELRKEPEVRDCVVVVRTSKVERDGNAEPCAVLLLRDSSAAPNSETPPRLSRRANARLAPFQQMRRWMVWRDSDFPRTPSQKPILARIRAAAEAEFGAACDGSGNRGADAVPLAILLARVSRDSSPKRTDDDRRMVTLRKITTQLDRASRAAGRARRPLPGGFERNAFLKRGNGRRSRTFAPAAVRAPAVFHYPRWAQSWPAANRSRRCL